MPEQSEERAKQRMRELSQAVQNAARELDRAYPNTKRGDRIVNDFQQQANRRVLGSKWHDKRPKDEPRLFSSSGHTNEIPFGLIVVLLAVIIPLLWMLTCAAIT
jgi:hypothetical protein